MIKTNILEETSEYKIIQTNDVDVLIEVDIITSRYIQPLRDIYKEFDSWFYSKFIPELVTPKRSVIFIQSNEEVVGFSFLKFTKEEDKICTFYIDPKFRGKGFANKLLDHSLGMFKDKDIHITSFKEDFIKFIFNYFNKKANWAIDMPILLK